jgi:hypothetical protein
MVVMTPGMVLYPYVTEITFIAGSPGTSRFHRRRHAWKELHD